MRRLPRTVQSSLLSAPHHRGMSRRPHPLPASLGAVFTAEQARAAGVTARRLRAGDIAHPHRGLLARIPTTESNDPLPADDGPFALDRAQRAEMLGRARLYRPLLVKHAFFVGRTAAGIWGLPVDCAGDLEVGVTAPHRAPRRRGIAGRQVAPGLVFVREEEGLPVTSPASTWAMLGAELSVRELIVVGDAAVFVPRDRSGARRPDRALSTVHQLRAAAEAGARRGADRLRRAIERIRTQSESPLETTFRLDAEDAGLPVPVLDVEIRDRRGRLLGATEIAYPEQRVLVEIEGDHHRTSRAQWNRDIEKYAAYVAEGYEVIRLTSVHVHSGRAVLMVREALIRRGWHP